MHRGRVAGGAPLRSNVHDAAHRTVVEAQAERTAALDIHDARCVAEPSSGRETSSCSTLSGGEVLMPPRRLLHRAASTASMPPPTLKAN